MHIVSYLTDGAMIWVGLAQLGRGQPKEEWFHEPHNGRVIWGRYSYVVYPRCSFDECGWVNPFDPLELYLKGRSGPINLGWPGT